jgi:DNA-binding CsgD family transcriptional regulator
VAHQLLERDAEVAAIEAAIEDAGGGLVLIEGPAGIGKSALLRHAEAAGRRRGMRVLRARGSELGSGQPYRLLIELFETLVKRLGSAERAALFAGAALLAAQVIDPETGTEVSVSGMAMARSLFWFVANLNDQGPLLLAVDDLHWADVSSVALLANVASRLDEVPVTICGALRPGEGRRGTELSELLAEPAARRLTPKPLSAAAVAELVGDATPAFVSACAHATGGNPFLLTELLADEGLRRDDTGAAALADRAPDTVLRDTVRRIERLPPQALDLARVVAVADGELPLAAAAGLAGVHTDAAALADQLAALAILAPGEPLAFRHPLQRTAIYSDIPSAARAELHAAVARTQIAAGLAPRRVTTHLLRAPREGDGERVGHLRDAAAALGAEGVPGSAAALLRRAVLEPASEPLRPALLVDLGLAEGAAGEGGADRLREAIALLHPGDGRARARLHLGRLLLIGGERLEARDAIEAALAETADSGLRAELEGVWLAVARLEVSMRKGAAQRMAELVADPPIGDTYGERALLAQISNHLVFQAERREFACALARRALADGRLIAEETADGVSWVIANGTLGWADEFDEWDRVMVAAEADARRHGSVTAAATVAYGRSFSEYYRGRLADAAADAQQAVDAQQHGWTLFLTAARGQLAWALIELGDVAGARAVLDAAKADPVFAGDASASLIHETVARLELASGDPAAAWEAAMRSGEVVEQSGIVNATVMPWRVRAATAAARLGEPERARELAAEGLRLQRSWGAPRALGMMLTATGLVAGGDEGLALLREAVAVLEGSPAELEYVRARVELGAGLRRRGNRAEARDILRAAAADAQRLGARLLMDQALDELLAAGARARRPAERGVAALTPSELRVARLAARGMSNRDIAQTLVVSLRTVESHLTSTYRKLGVEHRSELPNLVVEPR